MPIHHFLPLSIPIHWSRCFFHHYPHCTTNSNNTYETLRAHRMTPGATASAAHSAIAGCNNRVVLPCNVQYCRLRSSETCHSLSGYTVYFYTSTMASILGWHAMCILFPASQPPAFTNDRCWSQLVRMFLLDGREKSALVVWCVDIRLNSSFRALTTRMEPSPDRLERDHAIVVSRAIRDMISWLTQGIHNLYQ